MKRNDAEQIGKLIRTFLRQESLESPLNEQRLINSWAEILGPTIASYTRELYIRNQILYVHLTSAALRQELMQGLLVPMCTYSIVAIGLNLCVGYLGELSIGHAGFMCVGAFSSAFCTKLLQDSIQNEVILFLIAIQLELSQPHFLDSSSVFRCSVSVATILRS